MIKDCGLLIESSKQKGFGLSKVQVDLIYIHSTNGTH